MYADMLILCDMIYLLKKKINLIFCVATYMIIISRHVN